MSGNKHLSQDQIDLLEEHLPYELNALEAGLAAWASSVSDDSDRQEWFRRISAIEAFWVHARNSTTVISARTPTSP